MTRARRLALSLLVAPGVLATGVLAQSDHPPAGPGARRTPDGQPDVQGFYQVQPHPYASVTLERLIGMRFEDLGIGGPPPDGPPALDAPDPDAAGVIVDPPDGRIPYLPEARARKEYVVAHRLNPTPDTMDPVSRCLPPGIPRSFFVNRSTFQILQPAGYVVFLLEYGNLYRVVPLDGRAPRGDAIREWAGESRGHWDGNTLIIDVSHFNDRSWLDLMGDFHSDAFQVVERWTFDTDQITYRATFTDPNVFARPWTILHRFVRNQQPGYELMEFACWEGERSADVILKGSSNQKD